MSKFHINPATGEVGKCSSTKGKCPFGTAEEHYTSQEAASAAYEESMKGHAVKSAVKKSPKTPRTDFRKSDGSGYRIESNSEGQHRWTWTESGGDDPDSGKWQGSFSEALLDASNDWQVNGDGETSYSNTLRAAATRLTKAIQAGSTVAQAPLVASEPSKEYVLDYRRKSGDTALEGYAIEKNNEGQYRWSWSESGGEEGSEGEWKDSQVEALRDAAQDWDDSGDGSQNYASVLRGAATKLSKAKKE
jgi:hypothetical protein